MPKGSSADVVAPTTERIRSRVARKHRAYPLSEAGGSGWVRAAHG
jgi:hypothetical protein